MAQLVSHYIDLRTLEDDGTSLWHNVAQQGALMDEKAIDFLKELKLERAAEDADHQIPAEVLVRSSYRYKGQVEKLKQFLVFLWPKVEAPVYASTPVSISKPTRAVNTYTGISLKEWALAAHKAWQTSETAAVLDLMASYELEAHYNAYHDKRYDERPIINNCYYQFEQRRKVIELL